MARYTAPMSYEGLGKSWQRKAFGEADAGSGAAPGKQTRTMGMPSGGGEALPDGTRAEMERSFGADFSAVRVYQDGAAEAMGAQAMAAGADLHFAPGRYDPSGGAGKELLAHELAHTVQQAQGRVSAPAQGKGRVADDPALEAEADEMAARAVRGERADSSAGEGQTLAVPSSPGGALPAQLRIDRTLQEHLSKLGARAGGDAKAQQAHLRRYAFEVPVNDKRQTFREVVREVIAHAQREGDRNQVQNLWEELEPRLAGDNVDNVDGIEEQLAQLIAVINPIYDQSQISGGSVGSEGKRALSEWGKGMEKRYVTGGTEVDAVDPQRDVYTLYTVNLKDKQPDGGVFDVKEAEREEERSHVLFRDMTQNKFDFIFVALPDKPSPDILSNKVRFRGKEYRLDLMGGSFVKSGRALGIEVGSADVFAKMLGYEESVVYALRALFPQVVGGVKGNISARAYPLPDPKKEKEAKSLTFSLRDGTEVQLHDGWGYIKKNLADQMEQNPLTREKRQAQPASANANYQMMHWFDEVRPEVINELVGPGMVRWQILSDEAEKLKEALEVAKKAKDRDKCFELQKQLRENIEKRYSVLTTGRPRMESAVAMPVAGDNVVLPSGADRFRDVRGGGVSLLRSPADKPNWRPIAAQNVEQDGKRSELLAGMESIQYTLTGMQDGLLTFFKGMVGVISEDNWPEAWKGVDLVVTGDDRKLYEQWHSEQDRADTRGEQQDFSIQGSLVATQWYGQGTAVGVPNAAQKWMGGDYDGDEVNILPEKRSPELTKQIKEEYKEEQVNPKLPKSFTDQPESSREKRLMEMRSTNVSAWSGIASRLRSMTPKNQKMLAEQLHKANILSPQELGPLGKEEAMWMEVGKGIKVGTDGYKTSVDVSAYERRAQEYERALKTTHFDSLPYGKELMKTIGEQGEPTLTNMYWSNVYFSCVDDQDKAQAPLWGVPAATLATTLWWLFPEKDRQDYKDHYVRWVDTYRHFKPDPDSLHTHVEYQPQHAPEEHQPLAQAPQADRGRGGPRRRGGNRGHHGNRGRYGNRDPQERGQSNSRDERGQPPQ